MSAAEKFMFDVAFDEVPKAIVEPDPAEEAAAPEEEVVEEVVPTFSQEEVEQARQQGFEAGKQEGLQATTEALTKQINETLIQIDQRLTAAFQNQDSANEELSRAALSVALGIAKKMMPALAEKHGFDEVERVVEAVFDKIVEEPRVTVTVHSDIAEKIERRVSELSSSKRYEGHITIRADQALAPSDSMVEWANGGSERDSQALWDDILKIIARNLGDDPTAWDMPDNLEENALENQPDIHAPEALVDSAEAMEHTESAGETENPLDSPEETAESIVEDVIAEDLPETETQPETETDG